MRTVLIVCMLSLFGAISAKDLHFAYIRIDNSMDNDLIKEQLNKWEERYSNDDFVVYYSNSGKTMNASNWNKNELFQLISNQSSSISISIIDELETLSQLLEKHLKMDISEDKNGFRHITSTSNYESISFDNFVGESYFSNDYHNILLSKLIIVNSLNQTNFSVDVFYYPCGADYEEKTIQFNSAYSINTKPNIETL